MADLDADLYGDLYETDFNDPNDKQAEDLMTVKTETATPATPQPSEVASKSTPNPIDTSSLQTIPSQPTPIAPTLPMTQQIPTYEEKSEYRDSSALQGYQNISVSEQRPVRPSEMKDEGKMFIGGLNWDTTDEGLRTYFEQFGKVDACTIMRDQAGRSRCFAFLTFEDPASVNAVMVKEHYLDGKIIDPKRAIPRQEHQRATKLFIGGLPGSVTSESMREFFSQFGKVIDSTVMLDRETGRSKGFGFVSFEDTNVQPFLGFGNLEIDGKLIDVKLAQPRYQRENFQEDQPDDSSASNFSGGNRGGGAYNNFQGGGGGSGSGGNFNANAGGAGGAAGGAPFDPQALAALYTRMFQMANGGMGMMGGMGGMGNGMMGMGGGPGMGGNMMRNGMGGGMGNMSGMGAGGMSGGMGMGGNMGGGMGGGMGRGGMMQGGGAGGNMGQNIPKGPRGAPTGPGGMAGGAGVGPQRTTGRSHNYHPYARG